MLDQNLDVDRGTVIKLEGTLRDSRPVEQDRPQDDSCSLCAAQVMVDQVPPRRSRDPVHQRAVHRLAPRAAVAQGDAVWRLEGLR